MVSLSLSYTRPRGQAKAFSATGLVEITLTRGMLCSGSSDLALLRGGRGVWETPGAGAFYDLVVRPSSGAVVLSFGQEAEDERRAAWSVEAREVRLTDRDIIADGELVATHTQGASTWNRYPDAKGFDWVVFTASWLGIGGR